MLRSTLFSAAWSSVVVTFEDMTSNGSDNDRLPALEDLRQHHESVFSLIQIIDDAKDFMADERTNHKPHRVGKTSTINSSDSTSSSSSRRKTLKSQSSKLERQPQSTSHLRNMQHICNSDSEGASDAAAVSIMSEESFDATRWTLQTFEPALEEPPTLVRSVYSVAEDTVIWNAYIRNGCQILTPEACTTISHIINRTNLSSIQNQMKRLAAADQGLAVEQVKKCAFSERNDRRIWRTHLANQERARKEQVTEGQLCAAMTKYVPQSAMRIQFRLQLLIAEHDAAERVDVWRSKAVTVAARRRKRKRSGASLTYSAEEDQIVLDAYLSSSQPAERTAALASVAKGLNRSAGSVRSRIRRLLPDQPTQYHTADVTPQLAKVAKQNPAASGSSSNSNDDNSSNSSNSDGEEKNVGLPYTTADDEVVWDAYMRCSDQTPRLQALKQAATQLKRSLGGIISRVKHLKKLYLTQSSMDLHDYEAPSTIAPAPSSRAFNSDTTGSGKPSAAKAKVKSRVGCEYTEEEDMAIWEAYFSTTEGPERKEALCGVAAQFGRKFGAVRTHLQILLNEQACDPDDGSEGGSSDAGNHAHSSNNGNGRVGDDADDEQGEDRAVFTCSVTNTSNGPRSSHMMRSALELAFAAATTDVVATNGTANKNYQYSDPAPDTPSRDTTYPAPLQLTPSILTTMSVPRIPPLPLKPIQQTSAPLQMDFNQDEEQDAYHSEPRLMKFLRKLKQKDMNVLFPLEVHDQLMCIVVGCLQYIKHHCASYVSSQDLRKLFVRVKEDLAATYPNLKAVSNRKFYFFRTLLNKAECIYVERNHFMHTTIRLNALVNSVEDMRRRHDRYLCSLMTEHHAYLQNALCWPIDKAGKEAKSREMMPVLRSVETILYRLAMNSEFSYLREA